MLAIANRFLLVVIATVSGACVVHSPPVYTVSQRTPTGQTYCRQLGDDADDASWWNTHFGYALAGVGTLATAAGAALGPDEDSDVWYKKNRNVFVSLVGALVGAAGIWVVGRGDDADELAAAANRGMTTTADDLEAYTTCALARARWVSERVSSEDLNQIRAASQAEISALRARVQQLQTQQGPALQAPSPSPTQ